jgi:hypothetical protein
MRVNKMESIAVGPQQVPYVCNQLVTTEVVDKDGDPQRVCDGCAPEVLGEADVARLRGWARTVTGWAWEIPHQPEMVTWLLGMADQLTNAANRGPAE